MEALKTVTISKRAELAARGGHPWIYGSEIKNMEEGIAPGDMVKVLSSKGKFVGTGFYNPHSKSLSASSPPMPMTGSMMLSGKDGLPMPSITVSR